MFKKKGTPEKTEVKIIEENAEIVTAEEDEDEKDKQQQATPDE